MHSVAIDRMICIRKEILNDLDLKDIMGAIRKLMMQSLLIKSDQIHFLCLITFLLINHIVSGF